MKCCFVPHKFSEESQRLVNLANDILTEYRAQGYRLSLRQLYYQMVARDYIENTLRSYKRTGILVSDARLAGQIDWDMIEDRNRELVKNSHWTSPADIARSGAAQFMLDRWKDQDCHVEVMVEKDALSGILVPVCAKWDVPFMANKGYSSSSAMYEAGSRMNDAARAGKEIHVLYFGDHDPSGIDMTRDIDQRLRLFGNPFSEDEVEIEVSRLALNYDQVGKWNPPPNPAKETDSRFKAYVEQFGSSSWELDAVEPRALAKLVEDGILKHLDRDKWDAMVEREKYMKYALNRFADEYEKQDEEEDDD